MERCFPTAGTFPGRTNGPSNIPGCWENIMSLNRKKVLSLHFNFEKLKFSLILKYLKYKLSFSSSQYTSPSHYRFVYKNICTQDLVCQLAIKLWNMFYLLFCNFDPLLSRFYNRFSDLLYHMFLTIFISLLWHGRNEKMSEYL